MNIKNFFCSFMVMAAAPALADSVQVYGRGQGFDNLGNTQVACNQAYYAADSNMNYQCTGYNGVMVSRGYGPCQCFYAPGTTPYAINCVADTSGICQFQRCMERDITVIGHGPGGTTVGDRASACERAWERADNNAQDNCSAQRGYVMDSRRGNCTCHRKPGSQDDYNCDADVRVTCHINTCGS